MITRGLIVIAALLLVSTATPSASAETFTHGDPRGDMVREVWEGGSHTVRTANGDIRRIRLTYTDERLVTVVRFRGLHKKALRLFIGVSLHYRRGADHVYGDLETVLRKGGRRQPKARYSEVGESPSCAADSHIDYQRATIRFAMPARCIDDTPWVDAIVGDYIWRPRVSIKDLAPDGKGYGVRLRRG